jgi:hypothetical protein
MSEIEKCNIDNASREWQLFPVGISVPIRRSTISNVQMYIYTMFVYIIGIIFIIAFIAPCVFLSMLIGFLISNLIGIPIHMSGSIMQIALMPIPFICEVIGAILSTMFILRLFDIKLVKITYKGDK